MKKPPLGGTLRSGAASRANRSLRCASKGPTQGRRHCGSGQGFRGHLRMVVKKSRKCVHDVPPFDVVGASAIGVLSVEVAAPRESTCDRMTLPRNRFRPALPRKKRVIRPTSTWRRSPPSGSSSTWSAGVVCRRRAWATVARRDVENKTRTNLVDEPIKDWSLTSLKEKLIKIGAKVVSHGAMSRSRWLRSPFRETCSPTSCG